MKVRLDPASPAAHQYEDLAAGNSYAVIGIEADHYRLLNEHGRPYLYPATLFEVMDASEPEHWVSTRGDDGERYAYARELASPGFFEDWFDGNPAAVATLKEYLAGQASSARWVAGVDGCPDGWVAVLREQSTGEQRIRTVGAFAQLLELAESPRVIAIDVPIGLLPGSQPGGRACDIEARKLLGGRASSVFSAPSRAALDAQRAGATYALVSQANKAGRADAPGLSLQAFAIMAKIGEVDATLDSAMQRTVREVHPELSFAEANAGLPMDHNKKTRAGRAEREQLLQMLGFDARALYAACAPERRRAKTDDVNDACIACWTAGRIETGAALVVREEAEVDARGLRMEIWR